MSAKNDMELLWAVQDDTTNKVTITLSVSDAMWVVDALEFKAERGNHSDDFRDKLRAVADKIAGRIDKFHPGLQALHKWSQEFTKSLYD